MHSHITLCMLPRVGGSIEWSRWLSDFLRTKIRSSVCIGNFAINSAVDEGGGPRIHTTDKGNVLTLAYGLPFASRRGPKTVKRGRLFIKDFSATELLASATFTSLRRTSRNLPNDLETDRLLRWLPKLWNKFYKKHWPAGKHSTIFETLFVTLAAYL